ncbi:hypothetical protein N7462_006407 [Penicillium macrosclerotiorum]|uniref:uncharacterized protein n=1 Tax=Penicillium macrosclerotiorum TaxID=303699 RepID=UPI0025481FCE|nr:uncharacterized protein N7462_006407 [Penicillium macrosclerotiorum]KAJ5683242.1 hypothetical protein N7462_006407 [Penicillium macrosclerotiorum]
MPKSSHVSAPLRQALIECFRKNTCLVRPKLRRQVVLVGGAASIAHNSVLYTEDMDVAAPSDVIQDIYKRVIDGTLNFSLEPDGNIAFDSSQGIRVRVDIIEIGDAIKKIHAIEPFFEGSVASMSDLLRLRAVTVVERGRDGEADDFRWLLAEVAKAVQLIPGLSQEELDYVREAGGSCLGGLDRLVLYSILQEEDGRIL